MSDPNVLMVKDQEVLLDPDDYRKYAHLPWRFDSSGYVAHGRRGGGQHGKYRMIYLHRLIMGEPKGMVVDHINRDPLDNRKENLRVVTHQQNCCNRKHCRGKSDYIGVMLNKDGKWIARVRKGCKSITAGPFETELAAAKARDEAARELHGEFASLNLDEESRRAT